jgi:hypothetical protein
LRETKPHQGHSFSRVINGFRWTRGRVTPESVLTICPLCNAEKAVGKLICEGCEAEGEARTEIGMRGWEWTVARAASIREAELGNPPIPIVNHRRWKRPAEPGGQV